MATITLKLPDEVSAALDRESARRQISKSALVREAIKQELQVRQQRRQAARRWLEKWTGALPMAPSRAGGAARAAGIVAKHLK